MPMDEIIRGIEKADVENMQDVLKAVLERYRELYPDWEILLVSAKKDATDDLSKEILDFISKIEKRTVT